MRGTAKAIARPVLPPERPAPQSSRDSLPMLPLLYPVPLLPARSTSAIAHPLLCNRHHVFPHRESPIPDLGKNVFRDTRTRLTRHHLYWAAELPPRPGLHRREVRRYPLQCVSEVTGRTGDSAAVKDMDEHRDAPRVCLWPRVADNASVKSYFLCEIPRTESPITSAVSAGLYLGLRVPICRRAALHHTARHDIAQYDTPHHTTSRHDTRRH